MTIALFFGSLSVWLIFFSQIQFLHDIIPIFIKIKKFKCNILCILKSKQIQPSPRQQKIFAKRMFIIILQPNLKHRHISGDYSLTSFQLYLSLRRDEALLNVSGPDHRENHHQKLDPNRYIFYLSRIGIFGYPVSDRIVCVMKIVYPVSGRISGQC